MEDISVRILDRRTKYDVSSEYQLCELQSTSQTRILNLVSRDSSSRIKKADFYVPRNLDFRILRIGDLSQSSIERPGNFNAESSVPGARITASKLSRTKNVSHDLREVRKIWQPLTIFEFQLESLTQMSCPAVSTNSIRTAASSLVSSSSLFRQASHKISSLDYRSIRRPATKSPYSSDLFPPQ
jgi:hypothetical protein